MTRMQVKLTSQQHEILDYGTVFLFDENADLTLNIAADNSFEFILSINFTNDISNTQSLNTEVSGNCIKLTCINFSAEGTGLTAPMELAVVNGKRLYFMFWVFIEGTADGKPKVRKIEYTLYSE